MRRREGRGLAHGWLPRGLAYPTVSLPWSQRALDSNPAVPSYSLHERASHFTSLRLSFPTYKRASVFPTFLGPEDLWAEGTECLQPDRVTSGWPPCSFPSSRVGDWPPAGAGGVGGAGSQLPGPPLRAQVGPPAEAHAEQLPGHPPSTRQRISCSQA